jgi:hypothetical protein
MPDLFISRSAGRDEYPSQKTYNIRYQIYCRCRFRLLPGPQSMHLVLECGILTWWIKSVAHVIISTKWRGLYKAISGAFGEFEKALIDNP